MPNEKVQLLDLREVGATGLLRFSGFIYEEFIRELTGWKAVAIYKEMANNDATVWATLNAIEMLCRRVPWRVQPASLKPEDEEAGEYLESCQNDMDETWMDTISENLTMLKYGYSVHEIVYKRRLGDSFDPSHRSKYNDGRIGWKRLPIRSQDSIYRWQFDDHGGIQGVEQLAPPHYQHVTIPVEKMLLFRTSVVKNNPEGRSILRGAYRSWYLKKNIENIEGIGIERDLAGLPVALVPPEIMSSTASPDQKAILANIRQIVTNIRRDEQEGVIFPQIYDDNGKPMYELKLMSTGGQRQFDTTKIIQRYDQRIAMTALADFMLLGQDSVGSFALAKSKVSLFSTAIGAFLDIIADVYNRYAVPRLFALNDFQITEHPKIVHGDVGQVDLEEISKYILTLAQAGIPMGPDEALEKYLRSIANLPEPPTMESPEPSLEIETQPPMQDKKVVEIPANPLQTPTGLDIPADTTPVNGRPPNTQPITNQTANPEAASFMDNDRETDEALRYARQFKI